MGKLLLCTCAEVTIIRRPSRDLDQFALPSVDFDDFPTTVSSLAWSIAMDPSALALEPLMHERCVSLHQPKLT